MGFPGGSIGKESACSVGELCLIPGLGKMSWRRKWQPTPVFLPRESHGQRSLAGYSPWGRKKSDTTERLILYLTLNSACLFLKVLIAQSCLTLCDPMDCSPPGSSVHGILQARILAWVAMHPPPGDLPDPGIEPQSPALQAGALPSERPGKPRREGKYMQRSEGRRS